MGKNLWARRSIRCGSLLNQRVAGRTGNSALIFAIAGHSDVALITPSWSPRVLDKPVITVFIVIVATVSHGQNTMVQILATAARLDVDT